jgi:hypothetical protein
MLRRHERIHPSHHTPSRQNPYKTNHSQLSYLQILSDLAHSAHHVAMITGDNVLTAVHVAVEASLCRAKVCFGACVCRTYG